MGGRMPCCQYDFDETVQEVVGTIYRIEVINIETAYVPPDSTRILIMRRYLLVASSPGLTPESMRRMIKAVARIVITKEIK